MARPHASKTSPPDAPAEQPATARPAPTTPATTRGSELGTRREQLLDVAEALFSERGFQATSMREISRALGVKAGSLYSHISSKEEMLWEIVGRIAQRFCEAAEEAEASPGTAAERLRAFMRAHLRIVADRQEMATILLMEWRQISQRASVDIKAYRDRHEACLKRILDDGVTEGDFRRADVKWARMLILSGLNWTSQWFRSDGEISAEELADRYAGIVLEGIRSSD